MTISFAITMHHKRLCYLTFVFLVPASIAAKDLLRAFGWGRFSINYKKNITQIRHRVCHKLHHLRVVDLAPFKWNVIIHVLCRGSWNMQFCSFFIFKHVNIPQNTSIPLEYRSKFDTSRTRNISLRFRLREQTNGSTSTNNKMAVDSLIILS